MRAILIGFTIGASVAVSAIIGADSIWPLVPVAVVASVAVGMLSD